MRPNSATARLASQAAPLVCSSAVPTLMPMPNSTTVPHGNPRLGFLPGHDSDAWQEHQRHRRNAWSMRCRNCGGRLRWPRTHSRVSDIASSFFSVVFIGPSSASDLRICSRPPGILFDLGGHHPGHHEVERDRHQDAERCRGNKPFQPGDGFLQALLDETDRDHVLRGGGLDADVPDGGGLHRRDHQHAGEGAPLVDAEGGDDTERDRHQAGDARRGGGNQKRHHEADQNGAHTTT